MGVIALLVRAALAAVLAGAGAAKLLDRDGSRAAMAGFGLPVVVAPAVAVLLPLAEVIAAAALVIEPAARYGAGLALALFATMSAVTARALARGRAPDCHCFGQIHSAPVDRGTVARAVALAALALIPLLAGPGEVLSGPGPIGAEAIAPLLAAAVAILYATRRPGGDEVAPDRSALPAGVAAPSFQLRGTHGGSAAVGRATGGGLLVLVFVDPGCGPCRSLLSNLAYWRRVLAHSLEIAVVSRGDTAENRAMAEESAVGEILVEAEGEAFSGYRVPGTPCAILVDDEGTIASAPTMGAPAIEALLRVALERAGSDRQRRLTALSTRA